MKPQEGIPPLESENICSNCKEPQQIPLGVDDLCVNCFGYRRQFGKLP